MLPIAQHIDAMQVLSVQLPLEIAAHFGGKVPHITVSYAAGARAKEAGNTRIPSVLNWTHIICHLCGH